VTPQVFQMTAEGTVGAPTCCFLKPLFTRNNGEKKFKKRLQKVFSRLFRVKKWFKKKTLGIN
jgi:hypothetical protein